MGHFLKQSMQQKMLQKLSPQQIQLMKLLQVPTIALEQRIKEELEINPALEEGKEEEEEYSDVDKDDKETGEDEKNEKDEYDFDISDYLSDDDTPSYKTKANNTSPDDDRTEVPVAAGYSFHDNLLNQLHIDKLTDEEYLIAETLIGNLDDDGYLRRDLKSISNDLAFSLNIEVPEEKIEAVLHIIQNYDPPGVGARDLKECLLLQLGKKDAGNEDVQLATNILQMNMDEFSRKHYDKIMKQQNVSEERLKEAIDEILKLNPRPGNSLSETTRTIQHVIPDFIMNNNDGVLELTLNSRNAPELRVSRTYRTMLEEYSKSKGLDREKKEAVLFVKQKLDAAKWFIDAIKQRQYTLLNTMETIMNYQKEYFMTSDETKLKPMILKDIADIVHLDISTVSRVANSKYVQTPFGTFLLKSFFSESLQTESGEEVSSREVKKILSDFVEAENKKKPLTDQKLVKLLKEKGYNIARRTVAKYREQLNIPVARLRKEL